MKTETRNAHAKRIDDVVACLQTSLEHGNELPDLSELANVAHLSPFHFHRIWRALTGETIGRTVARLRLRRALHLLTDPVLEVGIAAQAAGYETPQAFARAFREALAVSPGEVRGQPDLIAAAMARLEVTVRDAGQVPLRIEVVSLQPFEVVALRNRGAFSDLDRPYGELFGWAAEAGRVESIIGLHGIPLTDHRDVAPEEMEFECAIRFSGAVEPVAPMKLLELGGGDYARIHHVGPYEGLEDLVDHVLSDGLQERGLVLRDVPIHYEFLDDPEHVPEAMLRADVFVPVMEAQDA